MDHRNTITRRRFVAGLMVVAFVPWFTMLLPRLLHLAK